MIYSILYIKITSKSMKKIELVDNFSFLYKDSRKSLCPFCAPFYKISSKIVDIYEIVINYLLIKKMKLQAD
ncbi:hypothetical protein ikelab_03370 [Lactococcus garvieae]|uniref:Uncharacterized protein n=1 Tax=Lactococcus garvieae TaxID=1363 RepID=A0A6L2ZSN7_9LACT|nr:hypothetical protein ikelab_03370 [Lactococcus garvieae]